MEFRKASRLGKIPPYLFAELDRKKKTLVDAGKDVISLGIGDPDKPTPRLICDALCANAYEGSLHGYPSNAGLPEFRKAVSDFFNDRYAVKLDPDTEISVTKGGKEAVSQLPTAFVNPGEAVLIPDPGYPVYRAGTVFCEAEPVVMPLRKENGFMPDLSEIDDETASRARIMWLNYPNNPTSAFATKEFFKEAVDFARKNEIILAHDAAYNEVYLDDEKPLSILEIDGAKEVAVEIHAFAKTFNMTGWRIGFLAGNADIVSAYVSAKANIDNGTFRVVQKAAVEGLKNYDKCVTPIRDLYRSRRDLVIGRLKKLGFEVEPPRGTLYVWFPVPGGESSIVYADKLLEQANVVLTPGVGFGEYGEGFLRIALTADEDRLNEAFDRIEKVV
ncbi:MAG: LL-diaminopimelate aminotransferase [Fibrobacterota bacterium]